MKDMKLILVLRYRLQTLTSDTVIVHLKALDAKCNCIREFFVAPIFYGKSFAKTSPRLALRKLEMAQFSI